MRPAAARRHRRRLRWLQRLPRDSRDTLFALLLIAWIILPQVRHVPPWCSAMSGVVLLWRGWLAVTNRPLPRRRWLVLLLVLAVAGTLASHRTIAGPEAGVTLLVTLLALKTLELRARRDALVVFFLGFFTVLTGLLLSQSLLIAAWMLMALLGLLTALVNAQRPLGRPRLRESAGTALRLVAAGLPVMLVLFLLFPRLPPLWSMPSASDGGRTGLSADMQVGEVAKLAMDDRIAFRVRFHGATPAQSALYFRGPVLERFDGQTWRADPRQGSGRRTPARLRVGGPAVAYTITQQPSDQPWLLALDATPQAPALPAPWRAHQAPTLQWLANRPITQLLRYDVRSHLDYRYDADATPVHDLALPPGFNPRTQALARQLRAQAGTSDRALLEAALQRLHDGGYRYTLEPGLTGKHAADEFWFDTRAGFCEHIASAFAVLMRHAGVPARIVTGFQGGERNDVDGYWVVRHSDAHAWTEVWLPEEGWLRVDPTAAVMPARIGEARRLEARAGAMATALATLNPRLLPRLRATWDAANNRWNQWVLAYSEQQQFNLLRRLGLRAGSWIDLLKLLLGLLVLATAAVAAHAAWQRRRHRDPWLRLLAQARQRLQRLGVAVPQHAGPGQLARIVATSALPATQQAAWQRWLLALQHWRYAAPAASSRPRLATLRRALRHIPH